MILRYVVWEMYSSTDSLEYIADRNSSSQTALIEEYDKWTLTKSGSQAQEEEDISFCMDGKNKKITKQLRQKFQNRTKKENYHDNNTSDNVE